MVVGGPLCRSRRALGVRRMRGAGVDDDVFRASSCCFPFGQEPLVDEKVLVVQLDLQGSLVQRVHAVPGLFALVLECADLAEKDVALVILWGIPFGDRLRLQLGLHHRKPPVDVRDRRVLLGDAGRDLTVLADDFELLEPAESEEGSLDLTFEAALGKAPQNRLLMMLQAAIHELWVVTWGQLGRAPAEKFRLHREHVEILAAIDADDLDAATALTAAHLDRRIAPRDITSAIPEPRTRERPPPAPAAPSAPASRRGRQPRR
jgi:hypothetical protein